MACRHKKGIILATAYYVDFEPDQEPFKADVIEDSGFSSIQLEGINIHWCPKCKAVKDFTCDGSAVGVRD